jgi:hypothetical protein
MNFSSIYPKRPQQCHTEVMKEASVGTLEYQGFELGPIRPPSEAHSLLLRVTRNCPWNKCKFCNLYRGEKFSVRPVDHLKKDIDLVKGYVDRIQDVISRSGGERYQVLTTLQRGLSFTEQMVFQSVLSWLQGGMTSVFLQDANTLVIKPDQLVAVLEHLRKVFPEIERVTSYARSHSIARISDEDLARLAAAGLNRIHIGMESGANEVLALVSKGVDQKTQIVAGQKVKRAGIELSEYVMPGLGGKDFSSANALQTAEAINQINPDFVRIRTVAIPADVDLYHEVRSGRFTPLTDIEKAAELLLFLDNLTGVTCVVKSDHILNLFEEVEGHLPDDHERMTAPLRTFMAMPLEEQLLYRVGRRTGIFSKLTDLEDSNLRGHAEKAMRAHRVTKGNIEAWTEEMMQRFI